MSEEQVVQNDETLEQEGTEEITEAEVSEADMTGKGKNKQGMEASGASVTDTGQKNEKPDDPKPNYTKNVGKAQAPTASGSGAKSMSETATRMGMIKSIYDHLQEMDKDQVSEVLSALSEVSEEEGEEIVAEEQQELTAENLEELKSKYEIDVKSDVEALIQGEELSEEFKEKAATIFEAAVFAKVNEEVNSRIETLEAQYKEQLDESLNETRTEMVQKVDDYLNYVVKEWMQENELAIEKGIRSEIVEDFMVGLKNLFVEHYIDIPDEKVDLVDDLFAKVEDLEESLNKEMEKGIELTKELKEFRKLEAVANISEDLTDVQREKMVKLAESVEYENDEDYSEKLGVLKENYFPTEVKESNETTGDTEPEVLTEEEAKEAEVAEEMSETMKRYSQMLSRTTKIAN
jgi:hypothetical protein|tara:strand:+ start:589 stop:1803 length:1215 start_codon:yes stop_codon:yes gene_type:complete